MKFVDLSQDPPVEVTVYTIREVAQNMETGGMYYGSIISVLQNWHDDPEIASPKPVYTINETDYWKPEQVAAWSALYMTEKENEESRKAKKLETTSLTKASIMESLIELATHVENRNSHAYSHNRGNSMQDARKRTLSLEGSIEFAYKLMGDDTVPKETRSRLNDLVAKAKKHCQMQ